MRQLCKGLYYGAAPKSATLRTILESCNVLVNLREPTATSHWYEDRVDDEDEDCMCISFPIPGDTKLCKDVMALNKLCHQLVRLIEEKGRSVYIFDLDGHSTCGPLVLGCWFWLSGNSKFDPISEIKKLHEFQFCQSKEQRAQVETIKKYAIGILRWQAFSKKK